MKCDFNEAISFEVKSIFDISENGVLEGVADAFCVDECKISSKKGLSTTPKSSNTNFDMTPTNSSRKALDMEKGDAFPHLPSITRCKPDSVPQRALPLI